MSANRTAPEASARSIAGWRAIQRARSCVLFGPTTIARPGLIWNTRGALGSPLRGKSAEMTGQNPSAAMATYRFFAVDRLDVVVSMRWIVCTDDARAREIGETLLTKTCGVEVWDV